MSDSFSFVSLHMYQTAPGYFPQNKVTVTYFQEIDTIQKVNVRLVSRPP